MEQIRYFWSLFAFLLFRFSYVTVHVPVFSACLCWFSGLPWCANHYKCYVRFFICIVYVAHIYGRVISANYLRQFLCMFYFWNHTYFVTFYSKFPFHSKYACYIHCKRISHFSFLIGICIKNDTSRNYYMNETKGEWKRQKNPCKENWRTKNRFKQI